MSSHNARIRSKGRQGPNREDDEIWRVSKKYPGYAVSQYGNVEFMETGEAPEEIFRDGHRRVILYIDGKEKVVQIRRMWYDLFRNYKKENKK